MGLFLMTIATLFVAGARAQGELREALDALAVSGAPLSEEAWREWAGLGAATPVEVQASPPDVPLDWILQQSGVLQRGTVLQGLASRPGRRETNLWDYRHERNLPPVVARLQEGRELSAEEIEEAGAWLDERAPQLAQLRTDSEGDFVSYNQRASLNGGLVLTRLAVSLALEQGDPEEVLATLRVHRELADRLAHIYRIRTFEEWVIEVESMHEWGLRLADERGDFDLDAWLEVVDPAGFESIWRATLAYERIWRLSGKGIVHEGAIVNTELGRFDDDPDRWSPFAEWSVLRNLEAIESALRRMEGVEVEEQRAPWYASTARSTQLHTQRIEARLANLERLIREPSGVAEDGE